MNTRRQIGSAAAAVAVTAISVLLLSAQPDIDARAGYLTNQVVSTNAGHESLTVPQNTGRKGRNEDSKGKDPRIGKDTSDAGEILIGLGQVLLQKLRDLPETNKFGVREKRRQRWVLVFNTKDGNDYAAQLHSLGAIIGVEGANGQYTLYRDLLRRPVKGQIEDPEKLNRIFWVDDKPESVKSLATALGIKPVPDHFYAFFPYKLEEELLKKELAHFQGNEEDIIETIFKVERKGDHFELVVRKSERRKGK
jgi:hypothetical protein